MQEFAKLALKLQSAYLSHSSLDKVLPTNYDKTNAVLDGVLSFPPPPCYHFFRFIPLRAMTAAPDGCAASEGLTSICLAPR
jgi:hypothetical protein